MTANSLEERRRYISQIKASFQDPGKSRQYQDVSGMGAEGAEPVVSGFFKLRLMIAAAIFAAFVYCDQNQVKIHTYTTKEVGHWIRESVSTEQVVETMKMLTKEPKKEQK